MPAGMTWAVFPDLMRSWGDNGEGLLLTDFIDRWDGDTGFLGIPILFVFFSLGF